MSDRVTCAMFDGLVRRIGGVDAAAAVLEARFGVCSKGTVSKMCSGQMAVTLDAATALEDALGVFPITRRLWDRMAGELRRGDLRDLGAQSIQASGAAHSALMAAFSAGSLDPDNLTPDERVNVLALMHDLQATVARIIAVAGGNE